MKILGFKGDKSRGKEIKNILEMLGGYDVSGLTFADKDVIYYIKPNLTRIGCVHIDFIKKDDFVILTIDEFKEKFIFNVGDLVRLGEYGKIDTVTKVKWDDTLGEVMYEINGDWYRYDECVVPSCKVEKKRMTQEVPKSTRLIDNLDIVEVRANEVEIVLDCRDSIDIKDNRISIIRTPKYPKTYEECCKVLGVDTGNYLTIRNIYYDDGEEVTTNYEQDILDIFNSLWKLRICRDAYWKIAGEEMGLYKPWEPDWESLDEKYSIYNYRGVISHDYFTVIDRCILSFPTEEMRNIFYENFKDLIESCKEFLYY